MIVGPLFPSRVSKRCPAIMFAVSRTASVPGRIMFLIVSMQTMKGIKGAGVPCGTKCSNMWVALLIQPNTINLNHKGRASVSVMTRCLVLVKTYGNRPKKLLNKINENKEMNRKVLPLLALFSPKRVLNSLCSFVNNVFHSSGYREGINHILIGIRVNPRKVLSQFKDRLRLLVDGSNTENKFLIIFRLIFSLRRIFFLFSFWFLGLLRSNLML